MNLHTDRHTRNGVDWRAIVKQLMGAFSRTLVVYLFPTHSQFDTHSYRHLKI